MEDIVDFTRIEEALQQHPGVRQAIVLAWKNSTGKQTIVAYLTATEAKPATEDIQEYLQNRLPDLLLPTHFTWMTEFPKTPSGRIDKRYFLNPESATSTLVPPRKTFIALFRDQVQKTPEKVAIRFNDQQITYRQLDERSNQLANYLQKKGVKDEALIPICVKRSLEMVISILGVLKAGGAFVPVDPNLPKDRISYMLSDTSGSLAITDALSHQLVESQQAGFELVFIDRDWEAITSESNQLTRTPVAPENLAYVLYTSGSTGKPKGVLIEHHSLVNFLWGMLEQPGITPEDTLLAITTISFDITYLDLFLPLLVGASIRLVDLATARDGRALLKLVEQEDITILQATPPTFRMMLDAGWTQRLPLKVLCGGEAMARDLAEKLLPRTAQVWNLYGPTETTVWATLKQVTSPEQINVGVPIANAQVYILDEFLKPVNTGEVGEIWIGGVGVARGYLNRPELNQKQFVANPFSTVLGSRMYRTGDLGRWEENGEIQCLGRIDHQVKIRGYRIELGEIEHVLQQFPTVKRCVVDAKEGPDGNKRLVGYVIPDGRFNKKAIVDFLKSKLPDYMVPQFMMELTEIPLTSTGKIDRKSLPTPDASKLQNNTRNSPASDLETGLITLWKEVLGVSQLGIHDNFFELGGNSILAMQIMVRLTERFGYDLPITSLYQSPTIAEFLALLGGNQKQTTTTKRTKKVEEHTRDVAVIGMAGRFPGASSVDELWTLLKEGREAISFFSDEDLDPSLPLELTQDPNYVKARGVIAGADLFDAGFFGLNPKLVELMDPQQRIFLEISWETLEKAGYLPQKYPGMIGVYAGCGTNYYYYSNVLANPRLVNQVGRFQVLTVNEKDYIASRTSFQLNLKGPAINVQSACSTSLLAIAQAVDSIRNGHCEVALAGGSSINSPINSGHLYEEGSILTPDGHCRSFDAEAKGTVFSDGAGVVLLKDAQAARRDGDTIYAIIKGTGVTNDGSGKGSFTAPSAEGQAGAIKLALDDAGVDPLTVSYVEAHGTATPIGDPIEIEGLKMAFGELPLNQYCAIGSIKSNLGHLDAAAGVAGFIKTVLALYHKQIPASLHFSAPNPTIDFGRSPFFVNHQLTEWNPSGLGNATLRRAGVSSFGIGGTNVHVILEEEAHNEPTLTPEKTVRQRPVQLISWSAKSPASREAYGHRLATHFDQNHSLNLANSAFTLHTTRADFTHRQFVVASTANELIEQIRTDQVSPFTKNTVQDTLREVVFLFPGQGAQYLTMGLDLYENEPVYKQAVDQCANLLNAYLETDIRQVMYPSEINRETTERLKNTRYAQPALFVTEYALARLWMSWGIEPTAFCGHSIGEFVGAHLAGVFSLEDAIQLIAVRGRLVSTLPRGSMLSVKAPVTTVTTLLPETVSIAAINSNRLCVVSGPDEEIAFVARILDEKEIPNRILKTSHAFHSGMMEPIVPDFEQVVQQIPLHRPQKRIVSTVSGTWLTDEQATDPTYWAEHLRLPVRFADALDFIFDLNKPLLLEVGPGNVTATLARQQAAPRSIPVVSSLDKKEGQTDYHALLNGLGQVWLHGLEPDWSAFYGQQNRVKVDLPTYAFDRKRFWVDPVMTVNYAAVSDRSTERLAVVQPEANSTNIELAKTSLRKEVLLQKVKENLSQASGIDPDNMEPNASFFEIGLDSLALTQVSLNLKKRFELPITFRQLNETHTTLNALVAYLDEQLPAGAFEPPKVSPSIHQTPQLPTSLPALDQPSHSIKLIAKQLEALAIQLENNRSPEPSLPIKERASETKNRNGNGQYHSDQKPDVRSVAAKNTTAYANGAATTHDFDNPPLPGARLGRDRDGNPAWFVDDPDRPGHYLQVIE